MSWLEGKHLVKTNGSGRLYVAAATSAGVIGVEGSGAIVHLDTPDLKGWAVEHFTEHLMNTGE
jgi:hypothetical protein